MMQPGMVLNERYEIIKMIGKGGMSTVYQARDLHNNNLLAVKEVARTGREDNQEIEQKLAVSEAHMLKRLSDPHLPKIYDIIEKSENFMLVMDYIHGESLDIVISRTGPQPVERVLNWGMQICEVFHYLHSQPTPIIYRDMKPANVILKPDGQLMMIDFGTARTLKQDVSMQADTICIGTAGFAAPEQFGGIGQSTERTDIFCLGSTLYNMVTGHSPCERPMGILPLERWNPALANSPISEIIYKCTKNDPDERYQTAMELYEDLRLASIGAYRNNSKGKSGALSGGLLKKDWQRQNLKAVGAVSGGLSGLLQRGRTGLSGTLSRKGETGDIHTPKRQQVSRADSGWQRPMETVPEHPGGIHSDAAKNAAGGAQETAADQRWNKLLIIAAVMAVVFVFFSVVLALLQQVAAAGVFLIIALGGAALTVVAAVFSRRMG